MSVFSDIAAQLHPRRIVELGCGDGASAAEVMANLLPESTLTTVNWPNPPSGDDPQRYLGRWLGDPHLTLIYGDTRDPATVRAVPCGIDLLHIDSTHTAECARDEWRLYSAKLADDAVVVVDDLDHNDMIKFWAELITDPRVSGTEILDNRVGVLRYKRHAQ